MTEPLEALNWLSEQVATTNQRLAVTVATVGLLVAVLFSANSIQDRLYRRIRPLYVDVIGAIVLVGSCLGATAIIVGVWGQTDEIYAIWETLDLGSDTIGRSILSVLLIVTALIIGRFIKRLIGDLLGSAASVTDHQQEVTYRISQVIIYSLALVVVAGIWIDDLGAIFVGAGFLGIVVGMAARQTLGSVISGFVLMFSRPFEIGDWIVVDDCEGVVTDISIINTRIRSFDGEYVILPNDVIGSSAITNRSRSGRLRIEIDVGVDYAADVDRAVALAERAVTGLDESLETPEPSVVRTAFGDSAVSLRVRFWIDEPSASLATRSRSNAIDAVKAAFDDAGIKIPYPQRELTGREETGGFRVAGERLTYDERTDHDDRATDSDDEATEPTVESSDSDERSANNDERSTGSDVEATGSDDEVTGSVENSAGIDHESTDETAGESTSSGTSNPDLSQESPGEDD